MSDSHHHDSVALDSEGALRTVYAEPTRTVIDKCFPRLDPHSRRFLELSPFFCIGSSRADGLGDVSPRSGEPGFVHAVDDTHIAFPDRPGNNRLDTLGNIIHQPAVGMLFFLPGVDDMLRINGLARVTTEPVLMDRFVHDGKPPRSVVLIEVREVYFHCSKALRRSDLWNPEKKLRKGEFPSLGQVVRDQFRLDIAASDIDRALEEDAKTNLY